MVRMKPHTVTLHGHELSYVDSGTGPTLLFIHGILGSRRQWSRLVDRLDTDHRVLVPDLFGHGESAKPVGDYSLSAHAATLRDLLDHLGVDRVTLVGHSLGGGIAMQFYYLFPERVDRLVLIASGGLGREVNFILRSATLPGAEQVLGVFPSSAVLGKVQAVGGLAAKLGWKPGPDLNAIWHGFTSLGDRESRSAFLATTRAVIDLGGQSISAHDHLVERRPGPDPRRVGAAHDRLHVSTRSAPSPGCRVELFEGAGSLPPTSTTRTVSRPWSATSSLPTRANLPPQQAPEHLRRRGGLGPTTVVTGWPGRAPHGGRFDPWRARRPGRLRSKPGRPGEGRPVRRGADMIGDPNPVTTLGVKDLARAREFYEGTLGFHPGTEMMDQGVTYQSGSAPSSSTRQNSPARTRRRP